MKANKRSGRNEVKGGKGGLELRRSIIAMAVLGLLGAPAGPAMASSSSFGGSHSVSNTVGVGVGADTTQAATYASVTPNAVQAYATKTIAFTTIPAAGSTFTLGEYTITFDASAGYYGSVDTTAKTAIVHLSVPPGIPISGGNLLSAVLTLSGLTDVVHGTLSKITPSWPVTEVTFVAGNYANGDIFGAPGTSGIVLTDSPGSAISVAQVDTITIGTAVDIGDVFTVTLPDASTASFTAVSTSANAVAAGLNAAIQSAAYYTAGGGAPTRLFDSTVASNVISLTARTPGTSFTGVSSGANNYAGVSAVAQEDTLTPSSVTVGETFVVSIGTTKYAYVAQNGDGATEVVTGLKTKINTDASRVVDASGANTLVLTAKSAGTPFTATPSVIGVADAAHSTLGIASSSLIVGGSTATATLTLKDSVGVTLIDVSGTGATLGSSDSAIFTVGGLTRSSTDGTITAAVTAVGVGSGTITGTTDGSTIISSAAPTVTITAPGFNGAPVLASGPIYSFGYSQTRPLYHFQFANTTGSNTLTNASVLIKPDVTNPAASSDFTRLELAKTVAGVTTVIGTDSSLTISGDSTLTVSPTSSEVVDPTATYTVQIVSSATPTAANAFKVAIPANAVTVAGSGTFTNSLSADSTSAYTFDSTSPMVSDPSLGSISSSGATLSLTSSETGTGYFVVLPAAAIAPSSSQVVSGKDANGNAAAIKGSGALTVATPYSFSITGLAAGTAYKAYFVTLDSALNAASGTLPFTSSAAASISDPDSTPTTPTTPSTVTLPSTVTVPNGITLTPVGSIGTVFTGPTSSGVTVSGGAINITPFSGSSTSAPLVLSSSVPAGTGIVLSAPVAGTTAAPVTFTVGGQTLTVAPSSSTLLTTSTVQVNGLTQQVLLVASGSANFTATAAGQVFGGVTISGRSTPLVLTANDSTSSAVVSSNASGTVITGTKGSITIATAGFANRFSAADSGSGTNLKLYAGEKLSLDTAGQVTAITLASGGGKDGAGDAISLPAGLSISGSVPLLNAAVERLSGKTLQQAVADALGATLNGDQSASGVLSLSVSGRALTALPVGPVTVNPSKADGVVFGNDGLVAVSSGGVTVKFAPSVADPVALVAALTKAFPGASASINASGTILATIGDALYAVRPDWTSSQEPGAAGFSTGADGVLSYRDAQGQLVVLHSSFLDPAAAQATIAGAVSGSTTVVNADGSVTLKSGANSYTLVPDLGLAALDKTAVSNILAGKSWWIDNGKLFLNGNGGVQGVTVR